MKISVTILSYNQANYLREAIDSVLRQTQRPDNLLIIDDYSSDSSQDIINSYRVSYPGLIDTVFHRRNRGVIQCRNEALQRCKGDLHAFLDGDDRFLESKLEHELGVMEMHGYNVIVHSNVDYIDENGDRLYTWADAEPPPEGSVFVEVFSRDYPRHNLFRSELVNVQAYRTVGGYDTRLDDLYEDYEMRIRLTKRYKTAYCNRVLSEYRLHRSGLSSRRKKQHLVALKYIYNKNKILLQDLPGASIRRASRNYTGYLSRMSLAAARETIGEGRPVEAFGFLADALFYKCKLAFT